MVRQASELLLLLDEELVERYKELIVYYNRKFPELSTLALKPIEYVQTIKAIGAESVGRTW